MISSSDDPIISAEIAERAALSRATAYRARAEAAPTEADRAYYAGLARAQEAIAASQRETIESLIQGQQHRRSGADVAPLPVLYTCVLRRNAQVLTAVIYRADDDAAAIAHLKEHCAETAGCTEGQLWRTGEKIFTHRVTDATEPT